MTAKAHQRLDALLAEMRERRDRVRVRDDLAERWEVIVQRLTELVPADLRARVMEAADDRSSPFSRWMWEIGEGLARLPAALPDAPAFFEALLRPGAEVDSSFWTCTDCGLARPRRAGRYDGGGGFFAACPACGSEKWMWTHRIREQDYPWQELDGCMGPPGRRRAPPGAEGGT